MTDRPAPGPDAPLAIAITSYLFATLVVITGELDISNVDQLEMALGGIALSRVATIRLDLGGLMFCDLRGARVLINFIDTAQQRGLRVSAYGARPGLRKVVRLIAEASLARQPA